MGRLAINDGYSTTEHSNSTPATASAQTLILDAWQHRVTNDWVLIMSTMVTCHGVLDRLSYAFLSFRCQERLHMRDA